MATVSAAVSSVVVLVRTMLLQMVLLLLLGLSSLGRCVRGWENCERMTVVVVVLLFSRSCGNDDDDGVKFHSDGNFSPQTSSSHERTRNARDFAIFRGGPNSAGYAN